MNNLHTHDWEPASHGHAWVCARCRCWTPGRVNCDPAPTPGEPGECPLGNAAHAAVIRAREFRDTMPERVS